ncbi:MAG: AIR synthase-related protein [Nanoarchaeota archaeon]
MYDSTKPYKEEILRLVRKTQKPNYLPHSSTDGIGTKGLYHWQERTFAYAVLDSLAMNLNDLAVMRAKPVELHDHIILPREDNDAICEIVGTLVSECQKRNITIDSGETSIHENFPGLEISMTINGKISQNKPNKFFQGDYLIGIESSGLHSNGFTKIRELFGNESRREFVEPTLIYSDSLFKIMENFDIHGMAHITGGAYTRLKDFLGNSDIEICRHGLKPQKIYEEIKRKGKLTDEEMYRTFNCGVGFILSVPKHSIEKIASELSHNEFKSDLIGRVTGGDGKIKIDSAFSGKQIVF